MKKFIFSLVIIMLVTYFLNLKTEFKTSVKKIIKN